MPLVIAPYGQRAPGIRDTGAQVHTKVLMAVGVSLLRITSLLLLRPCLPSQFDASPLEFLVTSKTYH
jgi:hypothetical protein